MRKTACPAFCPLICLGLLLSIFSPLTSTATLQRGNPRRLLDCTRPGCNFQVNGTDTPLAEMPPPFVSPLTGEPSPKIYIYDLPDKFTHERFWTLGTVSLLNRLRNSGYVTANGDEADYFWLPHSMPMPRPLILEMFDHIRVVHPYWNRTLAAGTARHIMVLPCEKGPGDCSFTMLFERELWPVHAPIAPDEPALPPELNPAHPGRRVIFMTLNGIMDGYGGQPCLNCFQRDKDIQLVTGHAHQCGPLCGYSLEQLRLTSPFSRFAIRHGKAVIRMPSGSGQRVAAAATAAVPKGGGPAGPKGWRNHAVGVISRLLGKATQRASSDKGDPAVGASSSNKGNQRAGDARDTQPFARGIAERLCRSRVGADGTPVEVAECVQRMYERGWPDSDSADKTIFLAAHRDTTLFWAGTVLNAPFPGADSSGRYHTLLHHHDRPGYVLANVNEVRLHERGITLPPHGPVDFVEGMRRAKFCLVPLGTRSGDPDRYIPAVLFQCVPVWVGSRRDMPMARPLEEHPDMRWERCSVAVDLEDVERMHEVLGAYSDEDVAAMRRCLAGMWQRVLYSSIFGSYLGEDGRSDAFDAIMTILRLRLTQC